jgi:hypothetical protein
MFKSSPNSFDVLSVNFLYARGATPAEIALKACCRACKCVVGRWKKLGAALELKRCANAQPNRCHKSSFELLWLNFRRGDLALSAQSVPHRFVLVLQAPLTLKF